MKKTIARLISFLFGPLSWTIFFFGAAYHRGLFQSKMQIVIIFMFAFLIPLIIYSLLLVTKKISDADITRREERYTILTVINVCALLLLFFLYTSRLYLLFKLALIVYVILTLSSLITINYKISFHITFAYTLLVLSDYLHSFQFWYLYLLLPAIFWSRLYLKRHTLGQLVLPLVLDSLILYTALT